MSKCAIRDIRMLLNKSLCHTSCIYLLYLGNYGQLKSKLDISNSLTDDTKIYKFGKTKNLSQRLYQHNKYFSSKNIRINLELYSPVSPHYITKAENDISKFARESGIKLVAGNYKELIFVPKNATKSLARKYAEIMNDYSKKVC